MRLESISLWIVFAALLPAAPALAQATVPAVQLDSATERLFQWGEYDSLIRILEPASAAQAGSGEPESRADSLERAKAFLYLGVGYFETGNQAKADAAFRNAHRLDAAATLDRFYVRMETAWYFQALSLSGDNPKKAEPQPSLRTRKRNRLLWWGMGTAALAATGAAAYFWASQAPEPHENVTHINLR